MTPDGTVSKSEFARLRGVSPAMVTKWIKAGRLVLTADGRRVNAAASLQRIAAGADPSRGGVGGHGPIGEAFPPASVDVGPAPRQRATFNEVRTAREAYNVKQAELDYRERLGELVERDRYDRAIIDGVAPIMAALDTLSARLGPALAAESDARKVQNMIDAEVAAIRREMADTLRRMLTGARGNS